MNYNLAFYDGSHFLVPLHFETLYLNRKDSNVIECQLTCQTSFKNYQYIETKELFSFNPGLVIFGTTGSFNPEFSIELKLMLQSSCFHFLSECDPNSAALTTYLESLNQEQSDHPLLFTESWLLLSAKQTCEDRERGYRTLWDYLSPTALAQAANNGSQDPTTDALISFFKDWTSSHLSTDLEQAASELLKNLETAFTDFGDTKLADIEKLFTDLKQEAETQWQFPGLKTPLLEQVLHFFTTEDWQFTKLQGEPTLAMAFQGQHGRWNCYAKVREEQRQFVFYSLCPIVAPLEKRLDIVHFLTLANYGMIIGNFELDFQDGEIRYKTSLDVTGDRIPPALIKSLVYTNVLTLDQYLPGIQAVLEGTAPADAIAMVEQAPQNSDPSQT